MSNKLALKDDTWTSRNFKEWHAVCVAEGINAVVLTEGDVSTRQPRDMLLLNYLGKSRLSKSTAFSTDLTLLPQDNETSSSTSLKGQEETS